MASKREPKPGTAADRREDKAESRRAKPGMSKEHHRPPVRMGEPFKTDNTLGTWRTR